jgi:hypothetical protein
MDSFFHKKRFSPKISKNIKKRGCRSGIPVLISRLLLASLIAHRAARLASGLAGRLALAAAALIHRALERRLVDRLDMLHRISSSM